TDKDELFARLAAQEHRRFIKTHSPLDGLPLDSRATYIVVARHPLDMAGSLYHPMPNIGPDKMRGLLGQTRPAQPRPAPKPLPEWLVNWIHRDDDPREQLDSLPGVMMHLSDAWARRDQPNIVLVHYDDLSSDLAGEMRRLAGILGIEVPE